VTTEAPAPSFRAEVVTLFKGWFPLTPPPGGVYNACTDEFVLVSGDYNLIVRMVTSASGRTQFRVHSQVNVKGTGATSGTEYVAMEVLNLTETAGPTGAAVFHMQYPLRAISKGSAANAAGHIAIQTTVNANGEITVDRTEFVFDVCGG
jgi:hypothetical protein